ncbi:MAG: hypothetical protein ISR75_06750 [Phycisphaerales bacterium]|nr:hypothetical protein [Phycisphaerales bacterium]
MKKKILSFVLTGTSLTLMGAGEATRPAMEKVYWDTVTETGEFSGGNLMMQTKPKNGVANRGIYGVTTLIDNGPPLNRIDLVFVGDGYTVVDLDDYEVHVNNAVNDFFGIEPLQTYLPLFNVHRVDVISNESGVDNDPVDGIEKDTAMDMGFWCSGIERLLCVDTSLAWGFANNVSSTDTILAVANSSMYGGAGYSWAEVGTFSGANSAATDVAIHEFGHSMANLADEYFYSGDTYTGPEPSERNASIYDASEMEALGTKWANWLGDSGGPWDGTCGTYEGCKYADYGIYRPSNNSMMRALNRPFNQPSAEAFILEMYNIVDPIDNHTTTGILEVGDTVFVTPVAIEGGMQIQWFMNNLPLDLDGVTSFSIDSLTLPVGFHSLRVEVVDPTIWVRDEVARESVMKQIVTWSVQINEVVCTGDVNNDGWVTVSDLLTVIDSWGTCDGCSADINEDGNVNVTDLLIIVDAWGECP